MRENYKIGDIYWVNLSGQGHVQNGWHPGIIVQCDAGNKHSETTVVVPITSKNKTKLPTHVKLNAGSFGLRYNSIAQCEGQQTVGFEQLGNYIGTVNGKIMNKIAKACLINTPYLQFLSDIDIHNIKRMKKAS